MKIEREALVKLIRATRGSIELANIVNQFSTGKGNWSKADEVAGQLMETLVFLTDGIGRSEEKIFDQEERHEYIGRLIADPLLGVNDIADMLTNAYMASPSPKHVKRESFEDMWKCPGGYLYRKVVVKDDPR